MAIVTTDNQYYSDIATAIRSKNGTETLYKPSEMAAAIQAISGGGEPEPPDDGKTRLYITVPANAMPDRPPPRNQVPLYIQQTMANGVTIDWGDGTAPETLPGTNYVNTTHTYEQAGDYVITLEPADGCELGFGNGSSTYCVMGSTSFDNFVYTTMLKKAYIGKVSSSSYAFVNCYGLVKANFSQSNINVGSYCFQNCPNLSEVKISDNSERIWNHSFLYNYSLSQFTVPSKVSALSSSALNGALGLKDVYIHPAAPPTIQPDTFNGVPSDCIYHVHPESLEAYKAATNWTTIADQIVGDLEV